MSDVEISDAAVERATGADWATWMERLKPWHDMDHTARVKALHAAHPDVDAWWGQMLAVEYERRAGLREVGQSCAGDYQVSCSKTVDWSRNECLERALSTPFLHGADWTTGATWESDGGRAIVRRVDDKMVRWFWYDADGQSTVELDFWPNSTGDRMQIRFAHAGLASREARERYRKKWKAALDQIVG